MVVIFVADTHPEPDEGLWFGLPPEPLFGSLVEDMVVKGDTLDRIC